eukprot:2454152-Pleurochrysis_carterae.AAC.1
MRFVVQRANLQQRANASQLVCIAATRRRVPKTFNKMKSGACGRKHAGTRVCGRRRARPRTCVRVLRLLACTRCSPIE